MQILINCLNLIIYRMTESGNQFPKISTTRDAFQNEAFKVLNHLRQNKDPHPKIKSFISFCILKIGNPSDIINLVKNTIKKDQDLSLFFRALYSVSVLYMNHVQKKPAIVKIYQQLLQIESARAILLENCDIPTQFRHIVTLQKRPKKKIDQSSGHQDHSQAVHLDLLQNGRKGLAKMTLLLTQITSSFTQKDNEMMWQRMLAIIGEFAIHPTQLLDVVIQSTIHLQKYESGTFLLKKIASCISPDAILEHLLINQTDSPRFNHKQTNESALAATMQEYSTNGLFMDQKIKTLVLLAKANILTQKSIFMKLQPQLAGLYDIIGVSKFDKTFQQEKQASQENSNLYDGKQQFLTQLIHLNAFDLFNNVVTQFEIDVANMSYFPLYFAISELVEWLIDPIFKKISFSHFFPDSCKRKIQSKVFPSGTLTQFTTINSSFFQIIFALIKFSGGNIFARRSTYLKFCRLCEAVLKNYQKLSIVKQELPILRTNIYPLIYSYLLPGLQFYYKDSSIITALNTVLQIFPQRYQQFTFLTYLKTFQYHPHPTLLNVRQVGRVLNSLLNKISNNNESIIQAQIRKIVESRPMSSLFQLIDRLIVKKTGCILKTIVKIVTSSHRLTKKVFIFYILIQLFESERSFVNKDASFTPHFNIFIELIREYLVREKQNQQLIFILMDYFVKKLKPQEIRKEEMATNYQFFGSEVAFFNNILQFILPTQILQVMSKSDNAQKKKYSITIHGGAACLKINYMQKIEDYVKCRSVRGTLTKKLLDSQQPFQTVFYKILILLFQRSQNILYKKLNLCQLNYHLDQISTLTNNLIQLIHLEANSSELIQTYFSLDLLDILLNKYKLPLETCFTLLRKSVIDKYPLSSHCFFKNQDWKKIKKIYHQAILKQMSQTSDKKVTLQNWNAEYFTKTEMQKMLNSDLYLLFWLLPYETSQRGQIKKDQYRKAINSIESCLNNQDTDSRQYKFKKAFLKELKIQQSRVLQLKYLSSIINSPQISQLCLFKNSESAENDFLLFIRKCVISRALISKSDAYFSWSFLLNIVAKYGIGPKFLFEIISILREQICKMLMFQTPRETTQLLPFLANLPNHFTEIWYDRKQLEQRLKRISIAKPKLSKNQHKKVINVLRKSSAKLINTLLNQYCKNNTFVLKNILGFILNCEFFPMFQDEVKIVSDFLNQVELKYKECLDITTKIKGTKTVIAQRYNKMIYSQSFEDNSSQSSSADQSKSLQKKYTPQPNIKPNRRSHSVSCSSETKSSNNFKGKPYQNTKEVIKYDVLKQMNIHFENSKERQQKACTSHSHIKLQLSRQVNIHTQTNILNNIKTGSHTKSSKEKADFIDLQSEEELNQHEIIELSD